MMKTANEITVTLQDARYYHGGCVEGWKDFITMHGYDFKTVVLHGLTAQQLIDTGDIMAVELANLVIARENGVTNG